MPGDSYGVSFWVVYFPKHGTRIRAGGPQRQMGGTRIGAGGRRAKRVARVGAWGPQTGWEATHRAPGPDAESAGPDTESPGPRPTLPHIPKSCDADRKTPMLVELCAETEASQKITTQPSHPCSNKCRLRYSSTSTFWRLRVSMANYTLTDLLLFLPVLYW